MKKLTFLLFGMLFLFHSQAQNLSLEVKVGGIQEIKGTLMMALFNDEVSFKNKQPAVAKKEVLITDSIQTTVFKNLKAGTYALAIFHDSNGDGSLNKRQMGIPTEGIAFSGGGKQKMRPPRFKEAAFTIKKDTVCELRMHYIPPKKDQNKP